MSARVLGPMPAAPRLARGGIVIADPVRAIEWGTIGTLYNSLLGRDSVLVPVSYVGSSIAATVTHTWRIRARARYQATHRVWLLGMRATGTGLVTFTDASSVAWTASVTGVAGSAESVYAFTEAVSARSTGLVTLAPSLAVASGSATVTVTTLSCIEVARPELATDTSDDGVDLALWEAGVPGPITDADLGVIGPNMDTLRDGDARNMFAWFRDTSTPISVTTASPSWGALFASPPTALARFLYLSETKRACDWYVYARASDGSTTGSVRLTMANGANATITGITTTTWAWYSSAVDVDTEDLSAADGRRAAAHDTATFEAQRTAGAGSVQFASVILTKG